MTDADERRSIGIMLREIETIPSVIADQVSRLRPRIRFLVDELAAEVDLVTDPPEVILTGCGDSHFAGIGARLAFEKFAGVRCRAIEALECARYDVRYVPISPQPPILVAASYSGEVGRTIEAASTSRGFGWRTIALTGHAESRLAAVANDAVLLTVPTLGFSPGTSTYVAMLLAMYILAAELARARGRMVQATDLERSLSAAADLASLTLRGARDSAEDVASYVADATMTMFLGAGPSRATAEFGAAKLFEGPHRHAVAQHLEEWAHEQYFVSGPRTPIVITAPAGASRDRAGELIAEMEFVGVPNVLVSDTVDHPQFAGAGRRLSIAAGLDEAMSPLLTCLPVALVAFFLAEQLGSRSYGFPSAEHEKEHYATIHQFTKGEPA